jgi:hypothetical protein
MSTNKPTPMKTPLYTPMRIISLGLLAAFATAGLHAQETGLRTDWTGGENNTDMRNPWNWTNGLPTPLTLCVVKTGALCLEPNTGSETAFTCAALSFQEDEGGDPAVKSLKISGDLVMKDMNSRWPNRGTLEVHQSGGNISSDSDLLFAVKPESHLDYVLAAGNLTVPKLATGDGKTSFRQTGGKMDAGQLNLGGNALGSVDYTISGGVLSFRKLILSNGGAATTLTVSGSNPVIAGDDMQVMPSGRLVFVLDGKGVATVGSEETPLFKAVLTGTVALKYSGAAPESGKVVNLIYANNIDVGSLVLDPETAAKWELVNSKTQKCSVFGLKAK